MSAWNPADKSSLISLSNGGKIATKGSPNGFAVVRSLSGATVKSYAEIYVNTAPTSYYCMIGLANLSAPLTAYAGSDANGWSYYQENGQKVTNLNGVAFGSSWATGDVIGIAYDPIDGKVWWSINNVWQASGNPATGANPAFTVLPSGLYLALSMYAAGAVITGRFALEEFSYAPPSGFDPWYLAPAVVFDASRMLNIF